MMRRTRIAAFLAVAVALIVVDHGAAQSTGPSEALRQQVERRFDVLPLHDGIALRPKAARRGVRLIEITDGTIAIDGAPATGAELRDKLGADADLVLRLSYLDAEGRRSLAVQPPAVPPPPAAVEPAPGSEAPAAPAPPAPRRRARRSDDRVRIGGRVVVEPDEIVNDVVVIGGTARIDGQVLNDVVVVGGLLEVGPAADIGHDVSVVGGTFRRDPAARIGGRISQVGPGISLRGLRLRELTPFFVWGA